MDFGSSALLICKVVNGVKHVLNIKLKSLCLKFQEKINTTPAPLADNVLEILTGEGLKKNYITISQRKWREAWINSGVTRY